MWFQWLLTWMERQANMRAPGGSKPKIMMAVDKRRWLIAGVWCHKNRELCTENRRMDQLQWEKDFPRPWERVLDIDRVFNGGRVSDWLCCCLPAHGPKEERRWISNIHGKSQLLLANPFSFHCCGAAHVPWSVYCRYERGTRFFCLHYCSQIRFSSPLVQRSTRMHSGTGRLWLCCKKDSVMKRFLC